MQYVPLMQVLGPSDPWPTLPVPDSETGVEHLQLIPIETVVVEALTKWAAVLDVQASHILLGPFAYQKVFSGFLSRHPEQIDSIMLGKFLGLELRKGLEQGVELFSEGIPT